MKKMFIVITMLLGTATATGVRTTDAHAQTMQGAANVVAQEATGTPCAAVATLKFKTLKEALNNYRGIKSASIGGVQSERTNSGITLFQGGMYLAENKPIGYLVFVENTKYNNGYYGTSCIIPLR